MAILTHEDGAVWLAEDGAIMVTEDHFETGAEWPETLPQAFTIDSYRAARPNTVIRSNPEIGPQITRRRSSSAVTPFGGDMEMTTTQKLTLYAFFDDSTAGGALQFRFPAPDGSGLTWDCRFTSEPEDRAISGSLWRVTMSMERLP